MIRSLVVLRFMEGDTEVGERELMDGSELRTFLEAYNSVPAPKNRRVEYHRVKMPEFRGELDGKWKGGSQ